MRVLLSICLLTCGVHLSAQLLSQTPRLLDLAALDSLLHTVTPVDADLGMRADWTALLEAARSVEADSLQADELAELLSIWQDPHLRWVARADELAVAPTGTNGEAGRVAWREKFNDAERLKREEKNASVHLHIEDGVARLEISSFGRGSDAQFLCRLRRALRKASRLELPLLLDLRGNTGGYRWRRHAVVSAVWPHSPVQEWAIRRHSEASRARLLRVAGLSAEQIAGKAEKNERWAEAADELSAERGSTDTVLVKRWAGKMPQFDGRVAVLLDAVSFSASIMLASELQQGDARRFRVFGCTPLGAPHQVTGTTVLLELPASKWAVSYPTTRSFFEPLGSESFGLSPDESRESAEQSARHWLMSGR
jgi:hypothetical protein